MKVFVFNAGNEMKANDYNQTELALIKFVISEQQTTGVLTVFYVDKNKN